MTMSYQTLLPVIALCGAMFPTHSFAESAVTKPVEFSVTADVGFGNEVCVMGNHPALGSGNPLKAPKLTWSSGNVWRGSIALEADTAFTYRFISRNFASGAWTDPANFILLGVEQSTTSPSHVAPPWGGKNIVYRSTFAQPRILYRDLTHGGAWTEQILLPSGHGRTPAEQTFRVDGLAPSGSEIEFVFHNGAGTFDNAPAPPAGSAQGAAPATPAPYAGMAPPYNYRTSQDVFVVQDGSIFNYLPPAAPSAPRFEVRQVSSTVSGVPGRSITILLPRAYDQNPRKRYPVLYFHDGQNVFFPGGPFGTWDADRIAGHEVSQGRMREAIFVAIPNGNDYGSSRLSEYLPDGETLNYSGTTYSGNATAFSRFLLDNVLPTLDFNYRTLTDPQNTLTAGSSMGGLFADHLAFSHPDRIGGNGIFSPAYWAAPGWVTQRDAAPMLPLSRYLYMGTAESSSGESNSTIYWRGALQAYDSWLKAGNVINKDLRFEGGAGEAHNEAAWSRHLPAFFAFAMSPWHEANPLAQELFPPKLDLTGLDLVAGEAVIRYTGMSGTAQSLLESGQLHGWTALPLAPEAEIWETREITVPLPDPRPARWFWKLAQDPWPAFP